MIIQKISDSEQIAFTSDRQFDFNRIIKELGYSKGTGEPYKYVQVDYSHLYFISGSYESVISTRIKAKGNTTYIINDSNTFSHAVGGNVDTFLSRLKAFGDKYFLKIGDVVLEGGFRKDGSTSIKNNRGDVISLGAARTDKEIKGIHNFIHRMKMDNGRMLIPMIIKFLNIALMFQNNKRYLLTGYANLLNYLTFIKNPSREILKNMNKSYDSGYVMDFNTNYSDIDLTISDTKDGKIVVDMDFDGDFRPAEESIAQIDPYILMTLKPIKLLNQRMPYFMVSYKNTSVFVTPLFFNSAKILKSLKGGINLLS